MATAELLRNLLKKRVLIIDGAMGSYVKQKYTLNEADYRGSIFKDHTTPLFGQGDVLNLSQPKIIQGIYEEYLEAGADFVTTNTFNATSVELKKHKLEKFAYDINKASASVAKAACMKYETEEKPRFVLGSIGPLSKTLSVGTNVDDPSKRDVTFDELVKAYKEQVTGLIDGKCDVLLVETVFDVLNSKAAIYAIIEYYEDHPEKEKLPIFLSATVQKSGRTLSGQSPDSFFITVEHAGLFSVGLNCGHGAEFMYDFMKSLSGLSRNTFTHCYPNAGLPNEFGEYDQTPEQMALLCEKMVKSGFLNMIGGCCGSTPKHIKAVSERCSKLKPRVPPEEDNRFRLSGLEPLFHQGTFLHVGERCNVAGSFFFKKLIRNENYPKALNVARKQVEGGAQILDICVDEPLLDQVKVVETFLNHIGSDPTISKVPIMIDSSNFDVILAALKCIQGKGVVNSISLKNGEEEFVRRAREIRKFGAAVVVMAFDEDGQAVTKTRKVEIAQRAYKILTEKLGFPPHDIIFDPNVLTIGTGMKEHNNYAVEFIEATKEIKETCPHCLVSGGVSNLSFAFRGRNKLREAMHAVFLYHSIQTAGMDMAIVNMGKLPIYDSIEPRLLELLEDLVLNRKEEATQNLLKYAQEEMEKEKKKGEDGKPAEKVVESWRKLDVKERLKYALLKGNSEYFKADVKECLEKLKMSGLDIMEGPLMGGMQDIGVLFGEGKMFLPQVIQSARIMKLAIDFLQPYMKQDEESKVEVKKKILLATVKGDVHDIGKNIVRTVLECNGYECIDLGVMTECSRIINSSIEHQVDAVGLSGLITPSLDEMVFVAKELNTAVYEKKKFEKKPPLLLIGGASTSEIHTFVKIAPFYNPVVHIEDASQVSGVVKKYLQQTESFLHNLKEKQAKILKEYQSELKHVKFVSLEEARENRLQIDFKASPPVKPPKYVGKKQHLFDPKEVVSKIDWRYFFSTMGLKSASKEFHEGVPSVFQDPVIGEQCKKIYNEAMKFLETKISEGKFTCSTLIGFYPVRKSESKDDVLVYLTKDDYEKRVNGTSFYCLRQQIKKENPNDPYLCLSDYVSEDEGSYAGFYVGSVKLEGEEEGNVIMRDVLCDRMAEALAEHAHEFIRKDIWGYATEEKLELNEIFRLKYQGIRPAIGYPSQPDHQQKLDLWKFMNVEEEIGVKLIPESTMMVPKSSTCAWIFAHPEAKYFAVGKVGKDQIEDYSSRKNRDISLVEKELGYILGYQ